MPLSICLETVPRGPLGRVPEGLPDMAHTPGGLWPASPISLSSPQFWHLQPLLSETCVVLGVACLKCNLESTRGQKAWAGVGLLWLLVFPQEVLCGLFARISNRLFRVVCPVLELVLGGVLLSCTSSSVMWPEGESCIFNWYYFV